MVKKGEIAKASKGYASTSRPARIDHTTPFRNSHNEQQVRGSGLL
jgi:hypothetical protein